ncbi:hypothetical protein C3L33_09985, partial [Rhododendron williamsianum]
KEIRDMGQQSLVYSFVTRGTVIVAKFIRFTGNFTTIASQYLQRLPATANTFIYNDDGHTFNYLVEDSFSPSNYHSLDFLNSRVMILGFGIGCACVDAKCCAPYCVVAVESAGRHIPIVFLERIRDEFTQTYGGGKAATAADNSLNMEFGRDQQACKYNCLRKFVILQGLDRGVKIELLDDKTENLRSQVGDSML